MPEASSGQTDRHQPLCHRRPNTWMSETIASRRFGVTSPAHGEVTSRAISGPTAYNGSNGATADYYQTAHYTPAGNALRNLALGNCTVTMNIVKQVVPS